MAKRNRDDFSSQVKRTLEKRVNSRCSNPECGVPTCGPTTEPMKFNSIGKAAHIAAAAPGGARYDPAMAKSQRSFIGNGIWLCSNCADMIDRDTERYPVQLLLDWKHQGECRASAEIGKPLPSQRELAMFKAKALGENVSSESISDLINTAHRIGKRELEEIDPRFTVDINVDRQGMQIALNACEPVDLKLCLPADLAPIFNEQLTNLFKHGYPLEVSGSGIRIQGSPLFDVPSMQPIKLALGTSLQRNAVQTLAWIDAETGRPMAAEIVGNIVGGTESFTFNGSLFGGLYRCTFHVPLTSSGTQTLSSQAKLTFETWVGQSIGQLPYLDKFFSLCDAVCRGQEIDGNLEIDGRELARCKSLALMSNQEVREVLALLTFLLQVRDVLAAFGADVSFRAEPIATEEALMVQEIWLWTCSLKNRHGKELGEANATIIPAGEAEAEMLKSHIQSGDPQLIRVEQEFAEHVSIMGQRLPDRKVTLVLTSAVFRIDEPISTVRIGQPLKVYFAPTEKCRAEVFVDPP